MKIIKSQEEDDTKVRIRSISLSHRKQQKSQKQNRKSLKTSDINSVLTKPINFKAKYKEHKRGQMLLFEGNDANGSSLEEVDFDEQNTEQICQKHCKKMEIFCLQCEEVICYQCGLFGEHKGHEIEEDGEFYNRIDNLSNALIKTMETITKNQKYFKANSFLGKFRKEKKLQFAQYKDRIVKFFEKCSAYLATCQKQVMRDLKNKFEFEEQTLMSGIKKFTDNIDIKQWKEKVQGILKRYIQDENLTSAFQLLKLDKEQNLA